MSESKEKISYSSLLRLPHAARTFGASLIGRLAYGVVFLSLVLAITQSTGSYSVAGVFMAVFGLTSAFLSPVRAALIDRYGLRRVLPPMATVYAVVLAAIATITWTGNVPHIVLWVLGATAGTFAPPLGPTMRTLWREIVDGDLLQRAYSLDTVVEELLYIIGPLLVGVFTAFVHPALGVAVSSGLVFTGTLLLMSSPVVSTVQQQVDDRREQAKRKPPVEATAEAGSRWRRGLAMIGSQPGVVGPVLVAASVGMCIGALSLLIVAFTTEQHNLAAAAWVEAALAVGSVIGGLVHGARTWKVSSGTRLSLLALSMGLAVAAAGLSVNIVMLAVLVAVVGLFISPVLATAYLAADEAAPASARTQAGAWVNTGFNVGSSGGVAGLGLLVSSVPLALCFVISGAPAVLAAVTPVALRGRRTDLSREGPAASVATERV